MQRALAGHNVTAKIKRLESAVLVLEDRKWTQVTSSDASSEERVALVSEVELLYAQYSTCAKCCYDLLANTLSRNNGDIRSIFSRGRVVAIYAPHLFPLPCLAVALGGFDSIHTTVEDNQTSSLLSARAKLIQESSPIAAAVAVDSVALLKSQINVFVVPSSLACRKTSEGSGCEGVNGSGGELMGFLCTVEISKVIAVFAQTVKIAPEQLAQSKSQASSSLMDAFAPKPRGVAIEEKKAAPVAPPSKASLVSAKDADMMHETCVNFTNYLRNANVDALMFNFSKEFNIKDFTYQEKQICAFSDMASFLRSKYTPLMWRCSD
jgi:hypothetical protein